MYVLGTHKGVEKAIPIIRRLIPCGHSQGVTLPKTWLQMAEEKEGKKIVAVAMEVNGCLTINPIFEKEQKKAGAPCQKPAPTLSNNLPIKEKIAIE